MPGSTASSKTSAERYRMAAVRKAAAGHGPFIIAKEELSKF